VGDVDVLIVGAGVAGAACAETLRAEGFTGSVLLCGRDPDPPYDRPVVSKQRLLGTGSEPWLDVPEDVDLRTRTSVMKLDPEGRVAKVGSEELSFDRALIATGANVRRLRVEGGQLEGIHYLRALGNADAVRAEAESAERVVLVGGSYIACEVAASLTSVGKQCVMVGMESAPLVTGFGEQAAGFFRRVLEEHGVELRMGETLARFEGADRVERVVCESGLSVEGDLVVMGTGAVPDVMLAKAAGLELGDSGGVRCDAGLRTSADGIWAAGDICEYDSIVHHRRLRVEHFEVARAQGAFAARAMLGAEEDYAEIPYFWSDLADWASLEYVGPAPAWDQEEVRGSIDDGEFSIFYRDSGGRVLAALSVGRSGDLEEARELMRSG
jgi:3-phenylpropionate/trans-cinnamate dioxygenase ferredoxin reductase subunit